MDQRWKCRTLVPLGLAAGETGQAAVNSAKAPAISLRIRMRTDRYHPLESPLTMLAVGTERR